MVIYDEDSNDTYAIDYREKAPAASFRDMYLDEMENLIFSNQHLDITQLVFQEQYMVFGVFIKGLVLCHGQIYSASNHFS